MLKKLYFNNNYFSVFESNERCLMNPTMSVQTRVHGSKVSLETIAVSDYPCVPKQTAHKPKEETYTLFYLFMMCIPYPCQKGYTTIQVYLIWQCRWMCAGTGADSPLVHLFYVHARGPRMSPPTGYRSHMQFDQFTFQPVKILQLLLKRVILKQPRKPTQEC